MRIKDFCALNNYRNRRWIYARAQNWSSVERPGVPGCTQLHPVRDVLKVITMYWPKTQFSTIFGPFSAQKRLRNGYSNGWETLERTASTSSSCNERLWGVIFAPGQASRRVSRAHVAVPLGDHGQRWPRITSISDLRFDRLFLKKRVQ